MPQVFGSDELGLINEASLWVEGGSASEAEIERATHPEVASEARARGLVPLRMGKDPIWHHPETGEWTALAPAHAGDGGFSGGRRIPNDMSRLRRTFPTPEETAKANRTPEQVSVDQANAAEATRSKKQDQVAARQRAKEQAAAVQFKKDMFPFANMRDVQRAFDNRSDDAKLVRPNETVEQYAARLKDAPAAVRQQLHQVVFPERYPQ